MSLSLWLAFFVAAWAISFSPGPGAIAVMSASLNHGFARGCFATFGLILGFWTQLVVVAVGLGAVIATSALAFAIVKWLGVAYLVYLGIRQWRAPPIALPTGEPSAPPMPRRRIVFEAWLLNAVNPKGTAFMLAVVPQFLTAGEPLLPQYLVIGATLGFTDLVVNIRLRGARRAPARRAANGGAPARDQPRLRQPVRRRSASCSRRSSAPEPGALARRASVDDLGAPGLDLRAHALAFEAALARRARRPRRLAHDRHLGGARDQLVEARQGVAPVELLAAMALRLDDDDALVVHAAVGAAEQARLHSLGQRRRDDVEAQVDRARDLVDVLAAGALRPHRA